ncbi:hypothetical protein CYY_006736 [Polysphondylium violaceum]|uniref:Regulator of chromosome condensation domain-containing protein n=1 Tax=Polysphondylium violaceum TaxID=133409 RepID=A0A8J4V2U8_9MYCE|nr:hypothetical protein CYY_006736 [Polysphondylium violaceum]
MIRFTNQLLYSARVVGTTNKSPLICSLYSWGSAPNGQLGLGRNITEQYTPKLVEFDDGCQVFDTDRLDSGSFHAILAKDKKIYSWGHNRFGQLGHRNTDKQVDGCFTPTAIDFFNGKDIVASACGSYHTVVSVKDGEKGYSTYSFGWADRGQLGHTGSGVIQEIPFLKDKKVVAISCGFDYTVVVTESDGIYTFGANDKGQCGTTSSAVQQPIRVHALDGVKADEVSCGWGHTLLKTTDGELISWGANFHGQCGQGGPLKHHIAPIGKVLLDRPVSSPSSGSCASSCIVDGQVYIWGSSGDGKLGLGETFKDDLAQPTLLTTLPTNTKYTSTSFGYDHCIALSDTNHSIFFGWGFGQHGTLGHGSHTQSDLKVFSSPSVNRYFENINQSISTIHCSLDTSFAIVYPNTTNNTK